MHLDFERVRGEGLVKTYGPTRALAGIDVELGAGEVVVVEGPNGSGKSTLLGILALLARPTRGKVTFGAHDAGERMADLRGRIGVLAHAAMVYPDLTGIESLALAAALHGVRDASARVASLRDRFEIGAFAERPTRTYSRGQLQRIALARALVHEPRLLLLDEPSTGLDATSLARLIDVVKAERDRGAIALVVTHDAAFAEAIADRRVVLSRGRVQPAERAA